MDFAHRNGRWPNSLLLFESSRAAMTLVILAKARSQSMSWHVKA